MDSTVRAMLAVRRSALIDEWFEHTLATYPPETSRLLATVADPFRNPAGQTLRENLAVVFDSAILSDDWAEATRALGALVQLRAVQDFSADQAVGFVGLLKPVLTSVMASSGEQRSGAVVAIDARIDDLTALARTMYQECRSRIEHLRANEAKRRTWAYERSLR